MDRNPRFGEDSRFQADARRVADLLWETCGTNFSEMPPSYLSTLRHEYSDGKVSMCELMDRIDLGPDATYEEYCEVFDKLLYVEPGQFPNPDSVLEVKTRELLVETQDFAEAFDFAEDDNLSANVEKFLRKVIASVYTDGVSDVSDDEGNPPSEANNYLLSDDGTQFTGVFYDKDGSKTKEFPFVISEKNGRWSISY
jgi:hypothetical protein